MHPHRTAPNDRVPFAGRTLLTATILLSAAVLIPSTAGARTGAPPAGLAAGADLSTVDTVVLPPVDEAAFLAEDDAAQASGEAVPLRFAAPIAVSLTPISDGTWETLADGSRIWRLEVISNGARTLNFGLADVRLPEGAALYFYPADRSIHDGPYVQADVPSDGRFWTAVIPGDAAVLEVDVPAGGAEPSFTLMQVGHDYRGFGRIAQEKLDGPRQGWCNNDVICPEGDPWREEIRSEGVYTRSGQWVCSGQMLASLDPNLPPYFLTANHCGINGGNAGSVVVYWNYESPDCGDLCCGSLADHQSGSTFKASYYNSDFCLIRLNQEPDPDWSVYYSGWDARDNTRPANCTCIHHPNCDEKAISFNYDPITVTSYLGTSTPGDGTHWRVDDWEDGTTEPGSSGSGIWDPDHHLVGQLHGGYASCSSITSDWFGRLARSWTGGGTSATRLSDWLDPQGAGTRFMDGVDPNDVTAVDDGIGAGSAALLASIRPNPARGAFRVSFELPRSASVGLELFDVGGRHVAAVAPRPMSPGRAEIDFGRGEGSLAPGCYFVRLTLDGRSEGASKLVVVE